MKNIWWKESNREDWSKYSSLTEDFIIFVVEEGLEFLAP